MPDNELIVTLEDDPVAINAMWSAGKRKENAEQKKQVDKILADKGIERTESVIHKDSMKRAIDKVYDIAFQNEWAYFLTCTINKENGFDMDLLKDVIELPIYELSDLTWEKTLGSVAIDIKKEFPMMNLATPEMIVKLSDYNKIAKLYGNKEYTLNDDEYLIIANYESIAEMRNKGLQANAQININGSEYKPKYQKCEDSFIEISTSKTNVGIIIVPDSANLNIENQKLWLLVANYNAKNKEEKDKIEDIFSNNESSLNQKLHEAKNSLNSDTKIHLFESSVGISTIVVFIAIYLGIIFLIVSCAILALKQLTESSDNIERYVILRKIGCDEKMINKSLFEQIAIFFMLPLILAIIHSIFGIQFALSIFNTLASKDQLLPSIILTIIVMSLIYGCYFLATYIGCKNIIKEAE